MDIKHTKKVNEKFRLRFHFGNNFVLIYIFNLACKKRPRKYSTIKTIQI